MSEIKQKLGTSTALTITLASLANGAGRCSTAVDNSSVNAISADIYVKIKTAGTLTTPFSVSVYLVRSEDGTNFDDGFAGSDAAFTPINATLIGIISAPTTGTTYQMILNTEVAGNLPRKYAIAIVNNTGVSFDGTAGNHSVSITPKTYQTV